MATIMNEQIKAMEVNLLDQDGQTLGIITTGKAIELAKQQKADLVVIDIMTSPPLCQIIARGKAKQVLQKEQASLKKSKEIRLTPTIEQHDLDTKVNQIQKLLKSGHPVDLVIKVSGKQSSQAKSLVEEILVELKASGKAASGIQVSGKQVAVTIEPLS